MGNRLKQLLLVICAIAILSGRALAVVCPNGTIVSGTNPQACNAMPTVGRLTVKGISTSNPPLTVQNDWGSVVSAHLNATMDAYGDVSRFAMRRANGSSGSPTQTLSGDQLGNFNFRGYTNSSAFTLTGVAQVGAWAEENFTSTANGASLRFLTTPIGSTTQLERMRIYSTGGIGINGAADPGTGAANDTAGYYVGGTSRVNADGTVTPLLTTVGGLPTCNAGETNARAGVTDADACTFLTTVTHTVGALFCPVVCDGTNWKGA
jgi:hypothetical protein